MSFSTITLQETIDYPHDEEYVYGADYTLVFEGGEVNDLTTGRTGIVNARILPERIDGYRAELNALWTFPRIESPSSATVIESDTPISLEEVKLAALGLITAIEANSQVEIEEAHSRYKKQAALRIEG